jgi:hypothetical protein
VTAELSVVHLRAYQRRTMVYEIMAVTVMRDGKTVLTPHTVLVEGGDTVLELLRRLLLAMPGVSLDDGTGIDAFSRKPANKNVPRCKFGHLDRLWTTNGMTS